MANPTDDLELKMDPFASLAKNAADSLLRVYRWLETDSPTLAKIVREKITGRGAEQNAEALAAAQATLADVEATIGGAMRPGMTLAQAVRETIQAAGAVDPDPSAFGAIQSRILRGGVDNVQLTPDELRTIIRTQPAWRAEETGPEATHLAKNIPLTAWACISESHVSTAKLTAPSLAKQLVLREMVSRALNALSFLLRAKMEGRPADPKALAFALKALGHALDVTTAEDTASP